MIKKNNDIKNQYGMYNTLLSELKIIQDDPIELKEKKSNIFWLLGKTNAVPENISSEINFIVEQSRRDNKYGIKLRCSQLTGEPFFRFDSDGPAHRNDSINIPLEDQLITTPHFNAYSYDGTSIAYKNDILKNDTQAYEIVKDVNFGISLFCIETKCQLINGNYPNILNTTVTINFENDICQTNYNDINFL